MASLKRRRNSTRKICAICRKRFQIVSTVVHVRDPFTRFAKTHRLNTYRIRIGDYRCGLRVSGNENDCRPPSPHRKTFIGRGTPNVPARPKKRFPR